MSVLIYKVLNGLDLVYFEDFVFEFDGILNGRFVISVPQLCLYNVGHILSYCLTMYMCVIFA